MRVRLARLSVLLSTSVALMMGLALVPALADGPGSPIGSLDSISVDPAGTPTLHGWAADPDSITSVLQVHVYIDGAVAGVLATGTESRGDVTAATGAVNAGFTGTVGSRGLGVHTLCAYGINGAGAGGNSLLACRQYGSDNSPFGSFDALAFGADGSFTVRGWAADADALTQPIDIAVWVDGVRGYPLRTGNDSRGDVASAVGATNAGFVGTVPPQGPGQHTACVYGINIGGTGGNALLGCKSWGVEQVSPTGSLDSLTLAADQTVTVSGWAADQEALGSPLDVHLYVDGTFAQVVRTGNSPRADVAAAVGAAVAGFTATLPAQEIGQYTVCAYGINIGPTGSNASIGCKTYGPAPRTYANCAALVLDFPHGVGRPEAHDSVGKTGSPVLSFAKNAQVYNLNTRSDDDGDLIACER